MSGSAMSGYAERRFVGDPLVTVFGQFSLARPPHVDAEEVGARPWGLRSLSRSVPGPELPPVRFDHDQQLAGC